MPPKVRSYLPSLFLGRLSAPLDQAGGLQPQLQEERDYSTEPWELTDITQAGTGAQIPMVPMGAAQTREREDVVTQVPLCDSGFHTPSANKNWWVARMFLEAWRQWPTVVEGSRQACLGDQ